MAAAICLTMTKDRCERLGLPPMVQDNNAQYTTNFTVSIEAAEGVTAGFQRLIAHDSWRCAANQSADLVQLGIFTTGGAGWRVNSRGTLKRAVI